MGSVLQNTQLNKVFLIYGHLDDMFISHNLQKDNFRFFLNSHLKNLGYEQVVFYSGAKNVGKFVLDDESAILAINKNKGRKLDNNSDNASKPQPEKKKRILNPSAKKKAPQEEKAPENVNKQILSQMKVHNQSLYIHSQRLHRLNFWRMRRK